MMDALGAEEVLHEMGPSLAVTSQRALGIQQLCNDACSLTREGCQMGMQSAALPKGISQIGNM